MWSILRKKVKAIAPDDGWSIDLSSAAIQRLPFPKELVLPLAHHPGIPSVPLVREGQEVARGEPIARARGPLSLPLHAPATGIIRQVQSADSVDPPLIRLELYPSATQELLYGAEANLAEADVASMLAAIQQTGVLDICGAALPAHLKLSVPEGKRCRTLIISAIETITCGAANHRLLQERPKEIAAGMQAVMRILEAEQIILALDALRPAECEKLQAALGQDFNLEVATVDSCHARDMERDLAQEVAGIAIPPGYLPVEAGAVVLDVSSLAQIGELLPWQRGLIERVVSVTGPAARRPGNYLVPLGTPLKFLLEHAGAPSEGVPYTLCGAFGNLPSNGTMKSTTKGLSGVMVGLKHPADNGRVSHAPA